MLESLGGEAGWRASLAYIERLLGDSNSGITPPAGMILEAVQGDVRGRGLMIGIEMVDTRSASDRLGAFPSYPELARRIQTECLKRGLILELGGRKGIVVRFLPPLIVTVDEIDRIGTIFAEAVRVSIVT